MATWLTITPMTSNRIGPARRQRPRVAHAVAPRNTSPSLPCPHRRVVASASESRRWTVPARSPRSVALSRASLVSWGCVSSWANAACALPASRRLHWQQWRPSGTPDSRFTRGPMLRSRPAPGLDRTTNTSTLPPPAPACPACSLHSPLPRQLRACPSWSRTHLGRSGWAWRSLPQPSHWPDSAPSARV